MIKGVVLFTAAAAWAVITTGANATDDNCAGRKPLTIYFATHAFEQPFFPVLKAGAKQGARDACMEFSWTQDVDFSIDSTIERMESAIATRPDILVFSFADPVAMAPAVELARASGIPVMPTIVQPSRSIRSISAADSSLGPWVAP